VIDLHSHLLPGIDDGSGSVEQSVRVLGEFAQAGITDVVLTPHISASTMARGGERAVEKREDAFQRLQSAAPAAPRLTLGFEIMLDQPLPVLAGGDRRFSLAGSRYYRVEFPLTIVPQFAAGVLSQMTRSGIVPLVAHPERYDACSPEAVALWRKAGARIQLDATTLTRPHSRGRRARALLQHGLADVVAADNHGDHRTMRTAAEYLTARGGERASALLTATNPAAVIADGEMMPVAPVPLPAGWGERIARLFGERRL
jgi:protein-tyrosine phosphatase